MLLSNDQDNAVQVCRYWYKNSLSFGFYLAGPAGSGKTSIAKLLAQEAKNPQFCAYTGRAALQLTKKGCPASTLHQLFYRVFSDDSGTPVFYPRLWNEEHPLYHCDLLLIDEASFVPNEMADLILQTGKPYLLIGDPYQLPPPTGGGAMIAGQKPDFLLTEIHRQAQDNPVLRLATKIRSGKGLSSEFLMRSTRPVVDALRVMEILQKKAPEGSTHMLLAGKKATVRALNQEARKGREALLDVGEPVLCLKNDHALGMMNGSIWTSQSTVVEEEIIFDTGSKRLYPCKVDLHSTDFDDMALQEVPVNVMAMLGVDEEGWRSNGVPCDYGYARTVHKAQGDEAYSGVIIDESGVFREARTKWLYTAVTRFMHELKIISPR
jgi:exodeoxyribonuclease-5